MRKVVYVLVAIVVIALLIVGWGALLPKRHHTEDSVIVKADPPEIWNAISDVKDSPQWRSDIGRVELLDDATPAQHWREFHKNKGVTYRLDKSQPTTLRVVSIDDPALPFGGTWAITVEPFEPGITHVRIDEDGEVRNPIYRWISRYLIDQRSSMDRYLLDLQRHFPAKAATA